MEKTVEVLCQLTKKSWELTQNGEAVLSIGGIRRPDGTILELAKPVLSGVIKGGSKAVVGNPVSGGAEIINVVSSVASNVQNGFIQRGVNKANKKLDTLISKSCEWEYAFKHIPNIEVLSASNLVVSLVNCAITARGFYAVEKKFDQVETKIDNFGTKLDYLCEKIDSHDSKADQNNATNIIAEFEKLDDRAAFYLENLERKDIANDIKKEIPDFLSNTHSFFGKFVNNIGNPCFPEEFFCGIVGLAIKFARILKYYTLISQLEQRYGVIPSSNIDGYRARLTEIAKNDTINSKIWEYQLTHNPEMHILKKKQIHNTMIKKLIPLEFDNMKALQKTVNIIGGENVDDFYNRFTDRARKSISEIDFSSFNDDDLISIKIRI